MTSLGRGGRALVALGLSSLALGLALGLTYLEVLGAAALGLVLADLAALSIMAHRPARLRPDPARVEVPRGSSAYVTLYLEGKTRGQLVAPARGAVREVARGVYELELRAARAGALRLRHLGALLLSPLRLASTEAVIPLRPPLEVTVVPTAPRALAAALATVAAGALRPAAGGQPLPPMTGAGTEYAYTDELREGDELRRVDWRATARRGRLMVKRFWAEAVAPSAIVVDLTATDEVSADELATEAASIIAALSGLNLSIYTYDGALRGPLSPASALAAIARSIGSAYPEALRVLDDYPGLKAEGALPVAGSLEGRAIVVTQLLSPLASIIPPGSIIVQPTEPWLWAPSLEEAYVLRRRHDRTAALARAAGCLVVRSHQEALRLLGALWAQQINPGRQASEARA